MNIPTRESRNLQYIRSSNRNLNVLKFSVEPAESFDHFMAKAQFFHKLRAQRHNVVSEAIFMGSRGRCDIFDLTDGVVYEIVCSEKEASLIEKSQKYPQDIKVIVVYIKKVNAEISFTERVLG